MALKLPLDTKYCSDLAAALNPITTASQLVYPLFLVFINDLPDNFSFTTTSQTKTDILANDALLHTTCSRSLLAQSHLQFLRNSVETAEDLPGHYSPPAHCEKGKPAIEPDEQQELTYLNRERKVFWAGIFVSKLVSCPLFQERRF